jgi:hypothetical protein
MHKDDVTARGFCFLDKDQLIGVYLLFLQKIGRACSFEMISLRLLTTLAPVALAIFVMSDSLTRLTTRMFAFAR